MAGRLQDVILRGTAALRPLATAVAPGTLYFSTDTNITERCSDTGTTWEAYSGSASGGTPALHAPTHNLGGTDPVTVTSLAGYPGGTTTFLRADHTFAAPTAATRTGLISMIVNGGASVISTGLKGYIQVPFTCTIQQVTLLADVVGSVVVDIWKDIYANHPPVVGDSITASAKPTLASAIKSTDSTLTGWTTSITANDILGFNVNSAATITKLTLTMKVQI